MLLGSALLAVVPFIAHPFLTLSVSAFDTLSVGAFTASLFGTLVLVAVPLLLLGAVSPWATRIKLATVEESGVVAGRLYALSTVGSLVGVFFVVAVGDRGDRDAADVPRPGRGARAGLGARAGPSLAGCSAAAVGGAGDSARDDQDRRGRRPGAL